MQPHKFAIRVVRTCEVVIFGCRQFVGYMVGLVPFPRNGDPRITPSYFGDLAVILSSRIFAQEKLYIPIVLVVR